MLDGYVARLKTGRGSLLLGADLDSLADVISFGVAPAVLGFTLGLRGGWDMLVLTYFVVCGVSRLARFNVTAADLADERNREGEVLPGDADSDQHPHRGDAGRGGSHSGGWTISCGSARTASGRRRYTRSCSCTRPAAAR